jgi:hypothetical protein
MLSINTLTLLSLPIQHDPSSQPQVVYCICKPCLSSGCQYRAQISGNGTHMTTDYNAVNLDVHFLINVTGWHYTIRGCIPGKVAAIYCDNLLVPPRPNSHLRIPDTEIGLNKFLGKSEYRGRIVPECEVDHLNDAYRQRLYDATLDTS